MKLINGRLFYIVPIIMFVLGIIINNIENINCFFIENKEFTELLILIISIIFILHNVVAIIVFFGNLYDKDEGYDDNTFSMKHYIFYYYDQEHGIYYNRKFPYIRAFSIVCWIFYLCWYIDNFFEENFTVKL